MKEALIEINDNIRKLKPLLKAHGARRNKPSLQLVPHIMTDGSIFCDLGCGAGTVVVQASLATSAQSFGIELVPSRTKIAKEIVEEFKATCRLWALPLNEIEIVEGDMLEDQWWNGRIQDADLILIANLVFEEKKTHTLWKKLQSIKLGAFVVTLKSFYEDQMRSGRVDGNFTIKAKQYQEGDVLE